MNANEFMPQFLALVTDIDSQTNVLKQQGIEESEYFDEYNEINQMIAETLLSMLNTLKITEKMFVGEKLIEADKGLIIKYWEELFARVNAYEGDAVADAFRKLLDLLNLQRKLFTHLPPFTKKA